MDTEIRLAAVDEIEADWREFTGGPPVIGILREYLPSDVEGLVWRDPDSGYAGVVTWWIDGERAEITSVHAEPAGSGTARILPGIGFRGEPRAKSDIVVLWHRI